MARKMVCKREIPGQLMADLIKDHLMQTNSAMRDLSGNKKIWIETEIKVDPQVLVDGRGDFHKCVLLVEIFAEA